MVERFSEPRTLAGDIADLKIFGNFEADDVDNNLRKPKRLG